MSINKSESLILNIKIINCKHYFLLYLTNSVLVTLLLTYGNLPMMAIPPNSQNISSSSGLRILQWNVCSIKGKIPEITRDARNLRFLLFRRHGCSLRIYVILEDSIALDRTDLIGTLAEEVSVYTLSEVLNIVEFP